MLQPYERLKAVFEEHKERLVRRCGIGYDLARKWLRGTDDMGTGRANPLQRVRDLIDEALIVDPSGEGARLIASDGIEYYEFLMAGRTAEINPKLEVNALVTKTAEVVCKLNKPDVEKMPESERRELAESLSDICNAAEKIGLKMAKSNARLFVTPRKGG
jgi:hypothetical protein